jgi:hypothetical protein
MKNITRIVRRAAAAVATTAAALCTFAGASEAQAQERDQTATTGWYWLSGVDAATVTAKINQGYRLVDIEVQQASPARFAAAFVSNAGVYQSGFWWYYGKSEAEVSQLLTANNARLVDLEVYFVNGVRKVAAVMVPNTGAQAKAWWWYYGLSSAQVAANATANGARVTHISSYVEGGVRKYAAIMIRNAGADQKAWWHYYNVNAAFIGQQLTANGARLTDIERLADNSYSVVMNASAGETWWWYYGQSMDDVNFTAGRNKARVFDVEPYTVNGTTRYVSLMMNNGNALEKRMSAVLRGQTDGQLGMFAKQVGGAVLGGINQDFAFEPASSIKVLHHLTAMERVQAGNLALNTLVPMCMDGVATSCPNTIAACTTVQNRTLQNVLQPMMQQSDNRATQAMREFLGQANINGAADDLGLDATVIRHTIGCGADMVANHNRTSLSDLGELHEDVVAGLLNPANRTTFYNLMSNGSGQFTAIVNAEGAALGKSAATINAFRAQVRNTWKGGSYGWNGVQWRSYFAETRLPFKVAGVVTPREYVHGAFIDSASTINPDDIITAGAETLREQIRAALATW